MTVFLSPSTKDYLISDITGISEAENMKRLADELSKELSALGYEVLMPEEKSSPNGSSEISNEKEPHIHIALSSLNTNTSNERGIKIYYSSSDGKSREFAEIISENLKKIYPTPENVTTSPNSSFVELLNTTAPSVIISVGNQNNEEDVIWFSEALNEIAENIAFSVNEILGVPEIPIPMTAIGIVNTSSGYATVRKSPSPTSRIITRIQNGAPVRIIGKLGNWYAIIAANVEGYILENEVVAETPEKS